MCHRWHQIGITREGKLGLLRHSREFGGVSCRWDCAYDVCVLPDGDIVVCGGDRLFVHSKQGEPLRVTLPGTVAGYARSVACDGSSLFVALWDQPWGVVQLPLDGMLSLGITGEYLDGKYPDAFAHTGGSHTLEAGPYGSLSAVTIMGNLVLATSCLDRVVAWDRPTLAWRFYFGRRGSNFGHFDNPSDLAVEDSRLYVADTNNHRVSVFSLSQESMGERIFVRQRSAMDDVPGPDLVLHELSIGGSWNGLIREPRGVEVSQGILYVAAEGCVLVLSSLDGTPRQILSTLGRPSTRMVPGPSTKKLAKMRRPPPRTFSPKQYIGVCLGAEGQLYVVDGEGNDYQGEAGCVQMLVPY